MVVQVFIGDKCPAETHDRAGFRGFCDGEREFSACCLPIGFSFAGDDEVCVRRSVPEPDKIKDVFRSRMQDSTRKRQTVAKTARRAASFSFGHPFADLCITDFCEMYHRVFEFFDRFFVRAFLSGEHPRRPEIPGQRNGNVIEKRQFYAVQ